MNYPVKKMRASLEKKGFRPEQNDHTKYFLYYNDKKSSIYTKISHGSKKDYGPKLCNKVRNQLKLTTNTDFIRFMDCPMEEKEYVKLLLDSNILKP